MNGKGRHLKLKDTRQENIFDVDFVITYRHLSVKNELSRMMEINFVC